MVADSEGVVHVAAQLGHDIYHVTNSSGRWTRVQLSAAPRDGTHGLPSITRDTDGSLWVAFTDRCRACAPNFSAGVLLTSMPSGQWSSPTRIPDHLGERPFLIVDEGVVHIGDTDTNASGPSDSLEAIFRPVYVTNDGVGWALNEVAAGGTTLAFQRTDDGARSAIYVAPGGRRAAADDIHLAVAGSGTAQFTTSQVVGGGTSCSHEAAFGNPGEAAVFLQSAGEGEFPCADVGPAHYIRLSGGSWSAPIEAPFMARTVALDADGAVHALAVMNPDLDSTELWYMTDAGGGFSTQMLASYATSDIILNLALALDGAGRSHIFFSSALGTFYAVAPAG